MSKVNISDSVMNQIHKDNIKMKPKIYFILGSLFLFLSLVFSLIASIFLISLTDFVLRSHGSMGQIRLTQLISNFPWWAPLLAIFAILISIRLLKNYDISYKKNFLLISLLLVLSVFAAGFLMDYLNLDNTVFSKGPMRGIMKQYVQNSGNNGVTVTPGAGMRYQKGLKMQMGK